MPAKKIVLSNDAVLLSILQNSFFQREGFEMIPVQDGQTGFQAVEAEAPTLAVLDLVLLGEQALECCRMIKNDLLLAATPVLLLLPDKSTDELAEVCRDAGCDAVVHRPMEAKRFLEAACDLLGIPRRQVRRFPVDFQLGFFDNEQEKHLGRCVNLNTRGMLLATKTLFPVDTHLTIEFTLPGFQSSLNCLVRVAWVNHPEWRKKESLPCGLGVQFVNPDSTVITALREFIGSLTIKD